MKSIFLSDTECNTAGIIGRERRFISQSTNRPSQHDFTLDGLKNDIESSAAELAVAKYLNIYPEWSPTAGEVPKFDLTFKGLRLDIKYTDRADGNLLIPYLDESLIYFLVCGKMPHKNVIGYLKGSEVSSVGQWRDDMPFQPCWFILASLLKELPESKNPP